jgi:hypothetical protein
MHPTWMPFTEKQLRHHFAPISRGDNADPGRHLAYYRKSLERLAQHVGDGTTDWSFVEKARQVEKDERFWIAAALMGLYYSLTPKSAFTALLERSGCAHPDDVGSWSEALDGPLELYFEAHLPAPEAYRQWLRARVSNRSPVLYVREAALRPRVRFEGGTRVDALLLASATGTAVLFEAKVLSDCSADVSYDALRNQLARNIDVMLEPNPRLAPPLSGRQPSRSSFVLLTPSMFRENRRSRLYGWLMDEYRTDPSALQRDLQHRSADWASLSARLGWATFEDCREIVPTACKWLA